MNAIHIERVISSPQFLQAAMLLGEHGKHARESYRPPHGLLVMARVGEHPAGILGLRRTADGALEAGHMHVRGARMRAVSRALVAEATAIARRFGLELRLRPEVA